VHVYQKNYGQYQHYDYKPHKERSGCLTILLVLGTLGGILNFFQGCGMPSAEEVASIKMFFGDIPDWYYLANGFITFMSLICLAGLWMWQKWGWYGWITLNVISLIIAIMVGFPAGIFLVASAISLGIWWAVLSPHWDSFE